jgi:hypothetical protein
MKLEHINRYSDRPEFSCFFCEAKVSEIMEVKISSLLLNYAVHKEIPMDLRVFPAWVSLCHRCRKITCIQVIQKVLRK